MKKSIKYAGIAAATLLAVAPVAAPVVSQAATGDDTSAAATTTNEITNDNITTAVSALKSLLTDTTYGDNSTNGSYPDAVASANYDAYQPVATFAGTGILNGTLSTQNSTVLGSSTTTPKAADASMKVYAVDSNNNKINFTNYTTLYNDVSKNNGSIKYYYQIKYNNTDGDAQTPVTGYFTLTNDNNYSEVKALNVTYTNPLDVAYGSRTVNAKLSSTIDGVVKDQNGNTIELDDDATTTVAGDLYKNLKAAITDDKTTDVFSDATFGSENKTYYQPVTITLKAGKLGTDSNGNTVTASTILKNYLAGEDNYNVTVNGSTMSGQTEANLKATDTTLTFVREVKVSQNASWTTEDVKGVVTTKSDASFYTLKDGDNNTVSNRALAKNTAWQTNAVRTDANGNKQYRVGADEWIDANNVTFSDKATDNNGEGAYTDVKALNGKVVTAGPAGFYYPLYDDNGKMVSDRGVAGETAWYTDKSAVNADGVTVYHVATGEWLQGTNATYTAY